MHILMSQAKNTVFPVYTSTLQMVLQIVLAGVFQKISFQWLFLVKERQKKKRKKRRRKVCSDGQALVLLNNFKT